jgi:hypothetical protein
MYLKEMRWKPIDWIKLTDDREQLPVLEATVMNLWVP